MKKNAAILVPIKAHKAITGLIMLIVLAIIVPACSSGSPAEIAVGSPAPDFSLPTSDGGTVSLEDYAGGNPSCSTSTWRWADRPACNRSWIWKITLIFKPWTWLW